MILVRYVGLKNSETDCVAGTGVTWIGKGDVQPVPDKAWAKLSMHPDVWELAEGQPAPAASDLGAVSAGKAAALDAREAALNEREQALNAREADLVAREAALQGKGPDDDKVPDSEGGETDADADLYNMNTEALRKYATDNALAPNGTPLKGSALRQAISAARKAKA